MPEPDRLELRAVAWPEIAPGDDLVALLCAADLRDGDVVVVTSKVVAKAEGRITTADRSTAVAGEVRRVVARRGGTVIAETRHGLVMAAAGVDASNTAAGTAVLLPVDPDASARLLRAGVYEAAGLNVAVVVSDTSGRAWRVGQTDLAVGCAGLRPLNDLRGSRDTFGNELVVTTPAVADEIAAAADLVKGKTSGCPVAVARGFAHRVLPPAEHGPGAAALVRPPDEDLFGLGAREAVAAAVMRTDPVALDRFPRRLPTEPDPFAGLVDGWRAAVGPAVADRLHVELAHDVCAPLPGDRTWSLRVDVPGNADADALLAVGRLLERAEIVAAAHHLRPDERPPSALARPGRAFAACWRDG